ncbi:MAG: RHS repeat protein [Gemmataceae bacterium]|nr:RHS repeat protein [Gemmataceae bacterium]
MTKLVAAGDGCSACSGGQGTYTYSYLDRAEPVVKLPSTWVRRVVEGLPDGNQNTYYSNQNNQLLLRVYRDAVTTQQWRWAYRYDGQRETPLSVTDATWRLVEEAAPSAVTGHDETLDDLLGYTGAGHLRPADGLMAVYSYGGSPVLPTVPDGFLFETALRRGTGGAAVKQETLAYVLTDNPLLYAPASSTVYRNEGGSGARTTTWSYAWYPGTAQPATVTTTLPTVTVVQNGPGAATSTAVAYDADGRATWAKDGRGFLTHAAYDPATGGVTRAIADVDTTQTSTFTNLPPGWTTPAGGGLHLTTPYEVDALGRPTKVTAPDGRVDYAVYKDAAHEARYYGGWTGTAPTGPTLVVREDRARAYIETLTMSAAPAVGGGRPTGAEAVSGIQSLTRQGVNAAGQAVTADAYFSLAGLTYTTAAALGTEGIHYLRTRYGYDQRGRPNRTQTPGGTIYRTAYDGLDRAVGEWAGTDDTPTSGFWSPSNTAGTDLAEVRTYEYDGNGIGDGNLTRVTERPGFGASDRVTQTWYDWRDRPVAVKEGVQVAEAIAVNRPLTYLTYNNLDELIKTRVFDADGVTVADADNDGVPDAPADSLLRARTDTPYDELGRVYRSDEYGVNQTTGAVGATLTTQWWRDTRGLVVSTEAPGGRGDKTAYDGAGRVTAAYVTAGGGGSYAGALNVALDTVWAQTEYAYDAAGTLLKTTARERVHGETATGALGTATTAPKARVTYAGYYYDPAGRVTDVVDVGTNGGAAWTRPATVPARSDTVLVTSTAYDAAGNPADVTGPDGAVARGTFDLLGRTLTATAAYGTADALTTAYAYDSGGRLLSVTAPGSRQTRYAYDGAGRTSGVTERYGTALARTTQYAYRL